MRTETWKCARETRGARTFALVLMVLGAVAAPLAGQTPTNHLYDKLQIGASFTNVILGSTIRVDGSQGNGTDVDAEDDLGLSKNTLQPRFNVRWRPGRRHELELGYQFARRSGDKVLARDIEVGDSIFRAGGSIRSQLDTDQAFLTYRFAFMAREKTQIGLGLGLGTLFFNTGIDALASLSGGGKTDSVAYSSNSNLIGPTASLGGYGRFVLGKAWYLEADIRGVKVAIDRFDAKVVEGGVGARYFVSSRVGIDGGYGISSITVDIGPKSSTSRSASGKIGYSLQHVRLGVVYAL
ncbi:MAG: hypothetical protein OEW44_00800 [Gemmatimonadota bacterium]|jgi:hypothetical protein|nr:hypothetical protein [Gemmatimonadota bacterium]